MGALRGQTEVNIRERVGRRKQKPVRRLYSRSECLRCLFGIWVRLECSRGLEGRYGIAHLSTNQPEREDGPLRTIGVGGRLSAARAVEAGTPTFR